MKNARGQGEAGFTLLEVIIVLVVVAVFAAIIYSYFGTSITGSSTSINRLNSALGAQLVMENITDAYLANTSNLAGLKTTIGIDTPTPPYTTYNNSYGSYIVIANHFINWKTTVSPQIESTLVTGTNCLKITIRDSLGEQLTQIYTSGSQSKDCK